MLGILSNKVNIQYLKEIFFNSTWLDKRLLLILNHGISDWVLLAQKIDHFCSYYFINLKSLKIEREKNLKSVWSF